MLRSLEHDRPVSDFDIVAFSLSFETDYLHVLDILARRDADAIAALPLGQLDSGNSEIRNWIAAAGAAEHLSMKLVDYVPSYRSEAGTGVGMAFALWQ